MSGVAINRLQKLSPVEPALGPSAHPSKVTAALSSPIDVNTTTQPQMGLFCS